MTQATIVIANGAGAAVRAALNSSNEALATMQSGSSAPSPTYPFMFWADTANDLLKQRNAANSAWIIKGTLSAAYGGLPASSITYDPGSPALLAATDVQGAIDELAANTGIGSWKEISRQVASASAQIDFTGLDSTYDEYRVVFLNVVPETDDTALVIRVGTGAGPTYQTANYNVSAVVASNTSAAGTGVAAGAYGPVSNIVSLGSGGGVGNATGENISGEVTIPSPSNATIYKQIRFEASEITASIGLRYVAGSVNWTGGVGAITALRFFFVNSGDTAQNIASGAFILLGRRKS